MNYPTKIHEILGVEPGEVFTINSLNGKYAVNPEGMLIQVSGEAIDNPCEADAFAYRRAINKGIIRRKRLTTEQVKMLKAMPNLYLYWLVKTKAGQILSYQEKPTKNEYGWEMKEREYTRKGKRYLQNMHIHQDDVLDFLVSWSDPEPLNIIQTLKDNGIEVEE
jgi:hypothetical protein